MIDVFGSQWNPEGKVQPEDITLPFEDESTDLVFLTSVFTRMLPSAVKRYIEKIGRILKPGWSSPNYGFSQRRRLWVNCVPVQLSFARINGNSGEYV